MITGNERCSLVGVFRERAQAELARGELIRTGFRPDQVEVVSREGETPAGPTNMGPPSLRAKGGAALGGLIGGIVGLLLGALIFTGGISGVGPVGEGGGWSGVMGAVCGLVVGSFLGALVGWGFMADDFGFYANELHAGRTLLKVHGDGPFSEGVMVLRRNRAYRVRQGVDAPTSHAVETPRPGV